ncbi:MAG: hypothetical protein KI790_08595, partial [Cyclobacteriaceae bacterium]|nr:hypothetical protein [Cyclobacteriaceae bacterium HetDA_MAG_MS6]
MKVVPQAFWQSADVEKILVDGLSCILYKRADQPNKLSDRHVSASAFTIVLKGSLQVVTDTGVNALIKAGSLVFLPKGLYMVSDLIPEDSY